MKSFFGISFLLLSYVLLVSPLADSLRERPVTAKVGYVPEGEVMRFAAVDHKQLSAAGLMFKVLIYFGTEEDHAQRRIVRQADYSGMERIVESLLKLDPYNMDAYYFTQAIISWEMGEHEKANRLLDYGMVYRDWDYFLPYFAGFNASYFLGDFEKAAEYYRRAGELTGADIFIRLAGRYLYEVGKTDLAIAYLKTMVEGATSNAVRATLQRRLTAIEWVKEIEAAYRRFQEEQGSGKTSVDELVELGFLEETPVDPYGGEYYIDVTGQVKSTSNFNFSRTKKK